jgi:hypothetical protein
MTADNNKAASGGAERRRAKRRPILETFNLFVVVEKKGVYKLKVEDISDVGIGFFIDIEGEVPGTFPVEKGEALDLRVYLNQALYLPVNAEVVRIEEKGGLRRIGAELKDKKSPSYKAFAAFLAMLDGITDVARVDAKQ